MEALLDSFVRCAQCVPGQRTVRTREIAFRSQGVALRGYLMLPVEPHFSPQAALPPVVVLSHGFSATQHMGLVDTGRALCVRTGCAALTFDHGGFGLSDGERHCQCRFTQAVGYLDAITYLRQAEVEHVDVDRICLWGESLSSRLALVAASVDPLVKGLVLVTAPCGRNIGEWVSEMAQSAGATSSEGTGGQGQTAGEGCAIANPSVPAKRVDRFTAEQRMMSDISASAVGQLIEPESVYKQMKELLLSMRASAARIDDVSLGEQGGARVLTAGRRSTVRVIPAGMVGMHILANVSDYRSLVASAKAAAEGDATAPGERTKKRRESTWLNEDSRCKNPNVLVNFLNAYGQLPRAYWGNEIHRVEKTTVPFVEQAAVPFVECSVCYIIAENDEMENCRKEVQYESFQRAVAAREPKMFAEVPCPVGGHAGMMDACGLIGHKQTWLGMLDVTEVYLRKVFDLR